MGPRLCALCTIAALLSPLAAAEEKVSKMVVLPFQVASGIEQKQGELLDEVMLVELNKYKSKEVTLIGSGDIATVLGYEQQKQLLNCGDNSCLVELGNAMGATHMLVLSLGTLGSQFLITAKVIDTRSAGVLYRKVVYADANEDALLKGVRQSAQEIAIAVHWIEDPGELEARIERERLERLHKQEQEEQAAGEVNILLYTGAGLAGVGALAFAGLGTGALAVDSAVVGGADTPYADREGGATAAMVMGGGSLLGVAALGAGAALIVISLM